MMVLFKTVIFYSYLNSRGPEIWQSRWHWFAFSKSSFRVIHAIPNRWVFLENHSNPVNVLFVGINTCQLSNSHFQPIYIYVYSISQANESRCLGVVKTCNHYVCKPLPFTTRRELSNRPCHELGLGRLNMVFLGEVFSRGLYSQSTLWDKKKWSK